MKFDEVLRDMADHAICDANNEFLRQHEKHEFSAFKTERKAISEGGHTFRIIVEFEPDPLSALQLAIARN